MELALLKGRWSSHRVANIYIYIYIADGLSKIPDLTMSPETRFLLRSWDPRHLGDAKGDRGTRP